MAFAEDPLRERAWGCGCLINIVCSIVEGVFPESFLERLQNAQLPNKQES